MPLPVQVVSQNQGRTYYPMKPETTVNFDRLVMGVNKAKSFKQLDQRELSEALNFYYNGAGRLVSRPGLSRYSTAATLLGSPIRAMENVPIAAVSTYGAATYGGSPYGAGNAMLRTILADDARRLYYLDAAGAPQRIGGSYVADASICIRSFAGKAVIMDGGYLKYYDGTNFNLAYDDGDGGYLVNNSTLASQATRSLYSGAATIDGTTFTTPAFGSGFTVPLTRVKAMLACVGVPTGNVIAKIYATSGGAPTGSALASSVARDVSVISTTAALVEFSFSAASTINMQPGTTYFIGIEFTGGDSSNYITLARNNAGTAEYYYSGSAWTAGSGTPLMAISPGLPPKAEYGVVVAHRLWIKSAETPGRAWYSNADTIFDWSTVNGSGWLGVVDDNANTYAIGAMVPHYSDLFIFGTAELPYLARIIGLNDGPEAFVSQLLTEQLPADPLTALSTGNSIMLTNGDNCYSLGGVSGYGDVRLSPEGDPVLPDIQARYDSRATAIYDPGLGLYLLALNGNSTVLACHTKYPMQADNGDILHPWTEWKFSGITPTAWGYWDNTLHVGGSDGYIYKLDTVAADNGSLPDYALAGPTLELDVASATFNKAFVMLDSDAAWTANLEFYADGAALPLVTLPLTDTAGPIRQNLNFNANSVKWRIASFAGVTSPLKFAGVNLLITPQEI